MRLACRFGRHTWSSKVEQGETYTVCTACGKDRRNSLPRSRWGRSPRADTLLRPQEWDKTPPGGGGGDLGV